MSRDSFIFYKSFYDAIKEITTEEQAMVVLAIMKYQFEDIEIELTGIPKAIFTLIKPQLNANNVRYKNGCKGGAPKGNSNAKKQPKNNLDSTKKQPKNNQKTTEKQPNENENENENENVNENAKGGSRGETQEPIVGVVSDAVKASKHKYGVYQHVLLKDEELQALQRDYPNWEELIKYLDEYIEMKGYKAKSHYLCIRRWVVNAVKEQQRRDQFNGEVETSNDAYEIVRRQLEEEGRL